MSTRNNFFTILLTILVVLVFWDLPKTYFQQDEWQSLGLFLTQGTGLVTFNVSSPVMFLLGQGRVLSILVFYFFSRFFWLSATPFAIFAIAFHSVNALLVFLLAKKFTKSNIASFLGTMFFAFNSVAQSAVTWPATSIGDLPSTALILLALHSFFGEDGMLTQKKLQTFVLLYLSIFFKETGIFLFILLPLYEYICYRPNVKKHLKSYWYYLAFASAAALARILYFKAEQTDVALFLTGASNHYYSSFLSRAVVYPLTSFSLILIPSKAFLSFARTFVNINYPFIAPENFIQIAQSVVLDFLSASLSFVLLVALLIKSKLADKQRKYHLFGVMFILFSFLPYVILSKNFAYLESRYYYVPAIGWSLIFSLLVSSAIKSTSKLKLVIAAVYVIFIAWHANALRVDITDLQSVSKSRLEFINQFKEARPVLEKNKNIFLITSDRDYYIPGNKIPFQSGTGQMLMVLLFDTGKVPESLLNNSFLFGLGSQGYKEYGDYGFGYFYSEEGTDVYTDSDEIDIFRYSYNADDGKLLRIYQE